VAERERVTNHDLAAFVDLLGSSAGGEAAAWVHYGLTSSDVLDTATGIQLAAASDLLIDAALRLFETVKRRAFEHRETLMSRPHPRHLGRAHHVRAEAGRLGVRDGPVPRAPGRSAAGGGRGEDLGGGGHVRPRSPGGRVPRLPALRLSVEPASTQVTARDRHAQYLSTLALVGASIERMATEIRHLQRSEVGEARESFGRGQKGSSAMPHKRNPILSERLTGLARLVRGYAQVGLENVALWHERDISHSSTERVVLPDASIILHYMLVKAEQLISGLVVDAGRMGANLESTRGLIYSQAALLGLIETGMTRDEAYRVVQGHAMRAWEGEGSLRDLIAADTSLNLDPDTVGSWFDPEKVIRGSETVFGRLESLRPQQPVE
jgi:adenylosuccinate lyase